MSVKVATWNLCLGLPNKKDVVIQELLTNKIDICCMQETELDQNFPTDILSTRDFVFEPEVNNAKKRVGVFINKNIKYRRRDDLEEPNTHVIIIDLLLAHTIRIISLYRSFRPPDGVSASTFFNKQLTLIEKSSTRNMFVLGDFNLDVEMQFRNDYPHKLLYLDLTAMTDRLELFQIVDFPTWSRTINNVVKQSTLDHVYTNSNHLINSVTSLTPTFGDHQLIMVELAIEKTQNKNIVKRNWSKYNKEALIIALSNVNLEINCCDVQQYWNIFENLIIDVIDTLVPITTDTKDSPKLQIPPPPIRNIINQRSRKIKKYKLLPSQPLKEKIKDLDKKIKTYFSSKKKNNIRNKIIPGDNSSLWSAVRTAKNQPANTIPKNLTRDNIPIDEADIANCFATFFIEKIAVIKRSLSITENVYNGKNKLIVDNRFFMSPSDITECMLTLKSKNCEGFDRIPVRILRDAHEILNKPLSVLFNLIYHQKVIPDQWKMAKIIPIYKKGNKQKIENYRPIANQCSTSKIFEKLILKQIHYLEQKNKLDFTCKQQHGFKRNKSTATAGLLLQSLITHATDSNNYALMASLDLSAAFDLVNVELLIKRLKIIGMPMDLVKLIEVWLTDRKIYVEVDGQVSRILDTADGTIQGSVLGPILYAIFVSPLFDLVNLTNFADDNFILEFNSKINDLIINMEAKLEMITKWLKDSGLKVNENKTEICLFHRNDPQKITIVLQGQTIVSKSSMNVLGVIFDSKLNWNAQVSNAIMKANRSLYAIKLLTKYFNSPEIKMLLNSYFYSTLYYNSQIWLSNNLDQNSKQTLLSASAKALRLTRPLGTRILSFEELHKISKQSTPAQVALFKLSIELYKLYNSENASMNHTRLATQIIVGRRQNFFMCFRQNNYKIGLNSLVNKFFYLNGKIPLDLLNLNLSGFKYKMKRIFKTYEFPYTNSVN